MDSELAGGFAPWTPAMWGFNPSCHMGV